MQRASHVMTASVVMGDLGTEAVVIGFDGGADAACGPATEVGAELNGIDVAFGKRH